MNTEHGRDEYPKLSQVFIIILITLFITFTMGMLGAVLGAKTELFLLEAVIVLPAVIFSLRHKYSLIAIFRLRVVNKNIAGISIITGVAFTVLADEIDRIVQSFFPMPEILENTIEASLKIHTPSDFVIIVFSAVFLAAIVEEMLFRGFVQTSFESHFDVTKAVMSSALIFVIIHFNPWWSIQVMIFGVILGVMAWKSNSIVPSMIVHFISNALALIFVNIKPENYSWYIYKNHVSIPIVIAALFITIYGMRLFYHFCESAFTE